MYFRPILERELNVASRLSATFRNRMLIPFAVAALGVGKVLLASPATASGFVGPQMFRTLATLTVAFCVFEGIRKAADCLSQEKREGTLGLLFLTDLTSGDVILGKLAAVSLSSFFGLFAMLPILGWSLFLGGVTPGEVFRIGLAAAGILFFSLTAGIWISARSYSASRAMAGAFLFILLVVIGPQLGGFSFLMPFSPGTAFVDAFDATYRIHPADFWLSVLISVVYSWGLLIAASTKIVRFREEESAAQSSAAEFSGSAAAQAGDLPRRQKMRVQFLGINPLFWLAYRGRTSPVLLWLLALLMGAGIATWASVSISPGISTSAARTAYQDWLMIAFILLMNSGMKTLLTAQACRCLAEARRTATLELLLCAPLKVDQILQGQILALRRTFGLPALVMLGFEMAAVAGLFFKYGDFNSTISVRHQLMNNLIFSEAGLIAYFLVDLQAVAWAGMWFGLCSRNESRATIKTVFIVIATPCILLTLSGLGYILFALWPIASLVWARLKLQEQFRSLAGDRLTSSGELTGWLPFEVPDLSADEPLTVSHNA